MSPDLQSHCILVDNQKSKSLNWAATNKLLVLPKQTLESSTSYYRCYVKLV